MTLTDCADISTIILNTMTIGLAVFGACKYWKNRKNISLYLHRIDMSFRSHQFSQLRETIESIRRTLDGKSSAPVLRLFAKLCGRLTTLAEDDPVIRDCREQILKVTERPDANLDKLWCTTIIETLADRLDSVFHTSLKSELDGRDE